VPCRVTSQAIADRFAHKIFPYPIALSEVCGIFIPNNFARPGWKNDFEDIDSITI
jgi:hypothetical protein